MLVGVAGEVLADARVERELHADARAVGAAVAGPRCSAAAKNVCSPCVCVCVCGLCVCVCVCVCVDALVSARNRERGREIA